MLSDLFFCIVIGGGCCLNPCSNGICSLIEIADDMMQFCYQLGLNPCSNGICSLITECRFILRDIVVLILVLMEYAL